MMTTWCRVAGVELTRYKPWELDSECSFDVFAKRSEFMQEYFDKIHARRDKLVHRWGTDPGCAEVSSVKLSSWKSLRSFFNLVDTKLDEWGFLRHGVDINTCGSGGHIHVAVSEYEAYVVIRHVLNNPWMLMAFADPRDDQPRNRNLRKTDRTSWRIYHEAMPYNKQNGFSTGKSGNAVSYRGNYGTVEFRLFDVAQTWEMQEEHMAFAQRFVQYTTEKGPPKKVMGWEEAKKLTVQQCQDGFVDLITRMGLPMQRYTDYVEAIEVRKSWGTKNFFPTGE